MASHPFNNAPVAAASDRRSAASADDSAATTAEHQPAGAVALIPTRCAICGTERNATELYPANVDFHSFNPAVFSARRLPDRLHYRLVQCDSCGLVRSDPVAPAGLLEQLYTQSTVTYRSEEKDLRSTYGRYLARLDRCGARRDALLEIGCGNGFFLEEALDRGYRSVRGVEPSRAAIEQAGPRLKGRIACGLMAPGLFEPASFDVICLFQVFDHVPDPAGLLEECRRLLRPGGLMLCLNHNIRAVSARLLGESSPIIDVEHTYLYSPATLRKLFQAHAFEVRQQGAVFNTYPLSYLMRLLPLPAPIKHRLLTWLQHAAPGRLQLSMPLGNLYLVAQNPP